MFRSLSAIDVDQMVYSICLPVVITLDSAIDGLEGHAYDANNGARNVLLRNTGSGFKDIEEAGLNRTISGSATPPLGRISTTTVTWLYVANDFESKQSLPQ